jgi:hypothetical protein
MNIKKIKYGFKIATIALTIMSIVGCTTKKPQPTIFGHQLNEVQKEKVIDEEGNEVKLDENHRIKTIKTTSKGTNRLDCEKMQWDTVEKVKMIVVRSGDALLEQTNTKDPKVYENKAIRMEVNYCKQLDRERQDSYSFTITVDSLGDNIETNKTMKSIGKFFAKVGLVVLITVGVIIAVPVFIVGAVVVGIPSMIYAIFSGLSR